MKLSIIVPVYDEIQTIGRVLVAVIAALPDVERTYQEGEKIGWRDGADRARPVARGTLSSYQSESVTAYDSCRGVFADLRAQGAR